jgi:hypothetical protein
VGWQSSDIAAIAQDDQLDDEIVVGCEIKREDERGRQPVPIKISVDIAGNDKVVVVFHDVRNYDHPFSPRMSRSAQPLMAVSPQLIVDKRIVSKSDHQSLQVEAVRRLDEGSN